MYHFADVEYFIRPYQSADFERICVIDRLCFRRGIAYSAGELRKYLGLRGSNCAVAELENEDKITFATVVGFILVVSQGVHGHIITLDVLEPHRGHGVGSLLLRDAEQSLTASGALEIWLETAVDNQPAIDFWQHHGYQTRRRLKGYYGGELDGFAMSKSAGHCLNPQR